MMDRAAVCPWVPASQTDWWLGLKPEEGRPEILPESQDSDISHGTTEVHPTASFMPQTLLITKLRGRSLTNIVEQFEMTAFLSGLLIAPISPPHSDGSKNFGVWISLKMDEFSAPFPRKEMHSYFQNKKFCSQFVGVRRGRMEVGRRTPELK